MIKFEKHDKTSIKIVVDAEVDYNQVHHFWAYWDAGKDWARELLLAAWRRQLADRLRSIRQKAYDRGWADAKAKRRKQLQYLTTFNDV